MDSHWVPGPVSFSLGSCKQCRGKYQVDRNWVAFGNLAPAWHATEKRSRAYRPIHAHPMKYKPKNQKAVSISIGDLLALSTISAFGLVAPEISHTIPRNTVGNDKTGVVSPRCK